MIDFLATIHDYDSDSATQTVWGWIQEAFAGDTGVCYYKHPVIVTSTGLLPDLTVLVREHQPLAIRCIPFQLAEIEAVNDESWTIGGVQIDSPILELEDFLISFKAKFDRDRSLRHRLKPLAVLALPLITAAEFERKFNKPFSDANILWLGGETSAIRLPLEPPLSDAEWRAARSISQGITPLRSPSGVIPTKASTLGEAIRLLDRQIALLDDEQEKVALQIPPGPQQIRGLAGTGKTVLLTMRAANIHYRFPEKRILFTFNTQSLYNQVRSLISKFYRYHTGADPNWDIVHVRHAWGGRNRAGVYYDLCARQGVRPLSYDEVRGASDPFKVCCEHVLQSPIFPEYDYILVDEAQDFPNEFFRVLWELSYDPHRIYWAFDELQSLFSLEIPKPEDRFGRDSRGRPRVTLEGDDYPGAIEKDFVLHRSYRCPQDVLMVAHAIGLGLYNAPQGAVQMLGGESSWKAIGYEIESGELKKGADVVLYRPPENSPNLINQAYTGQQRPVVTEVFQDRSAELKWIVESVRRDIRDEGVTPEQIIVVSLDRSRVKEHMAEAQAELVRYGIASTVPGLIDDTASFAESGRVTLSTLPRAKGNEAYIVYIFGFDTMYNYIDEVASRNRAFTAISRSKAWVRVTGVGSKMERAKTEIERVLADVPRFRFTFPDMDKMRKLDAETAKRRKAVKAASDTVSRILKMPPEVLAAMAESNPVLFERLTNLIEEAKRENQ